MIPYSCESDSYPPPLLVVGAEMHGDVLVYPRFTPARFESIWYKMCKNTTGTVPEDVQGLFTASYLLFIPQNGHL